MTCPNCQGPMWDNREKKASGEFKKTGPDFSCKDKQGCGHVIWPPRAQRPTQPVSEYTGDPSFQEDAKITRQRVATDEWQAGRPQAIPGPAGLAYPTLKDKTIAREAAAHAVSRMYQNTPPSWGVFLNKVEFLARYFLTGILPADVDSQMVDIPMEGESAPWEEPAQ